jgi:hypothetical protein
LRYSRPGCQIRSSKLEKSMKSPWATRTAAVAFVAFLLFLPHPAPAANAADAARFRVSVYANINTPPDSIPYTRLDALVLAFINPTEDCSGFANTSFPAVQEIVRRARKHNTNGRRIIVTFAIGGGGATATNALLESIASSADCRTEFAAQVAEILAKNDLDGVNIDWEFPKSSSLDNYTQFIKALRGAIGSKILTIAIYDDAGKDDPSGRLTPNVIPFVDYYMVMAYLAPPNAAIDSWIKPPWNLPKSKLRLGLALFGIADDGSTLAYKQILGTVPPAQVSPCGDRIGTYGINGLRTTGELTRFAMTQKLSGITGWALDQDRADSISLMRAASETSRMWNGFAEWQKGTTYSAGTIVQNRGNLWLVQSPKSAAQREPGLMNTAFKQIELTDQWSSDKYYCGGDEVWIGDAVYRAVSDPMLSVIDLSPTVATSLWKQLYAASPYDDAATYSKGDRIFFSRAVYVANRDTTGQSPASGSTDWSPYVDADAFDASKTYAAGVTVRYMGNQYVSTKSSVGSTPVVATDSWQPLKR